MPETVLHATLTTVPSGPSGFELESEVSRRLRRALSGLQFGQVLVSVEDGEVIRIERTERQRVFKRRIGRC
jgi:hypothetical protein